MTALLDSPRLRTPAMMYLFHRIDERLDGEPTSVLIDEGWKALDDPVFAARIRDWLKTPSATPSSVSRRSRRATRSTAASRRLWSSRPRR